MYSSFEYFDKIFMFVFVFVYGFILTRDNVTSFNIGSILNIIIEGRR